MNKKKIYGNPAAPKAIRKKSANKIENSFEMKNFQMRKFSVRFLACKLVIRGFLYKIKKKTSLAQILEMFIDAHKNIWNSVDLELLI